MSRSPKLCDLRPSSLFHFLAHPSRPRSFTHRRTGPSSLSPPLVPTHHAPWGRQLLWINPPSLRLATKSPFTSAPRTPGPPPILRAPLLQLWRASNSPSALEGRLSRSLLGCIPGPDLGKRPINEGAGNHRYHLENHWSPVPTRPGQRCGASTHRRVPVRLVISSPRKQSARLPGDLPQLRSFFALPDPAASLQVWVGGRVSATSLHTVFRRHLSLLLTRRGAGPPFATSDERGGKAPPAGPEAECGFSPRP